MSKNDRNIFARILIFIHIIFFFALFASGLLAGLYYSQPYIHVSVKIPQDSVNVWNFKSRGDGSVATGGNFKTSLYFYNTSIFKLTYEPQKIDIFYYPIGERPSCMFLHSADHHFHISSEFKNITKVYKSIDDSTDVFFKLNDLKLTVDPSKWDYSSPKEYELSWNMGFVIPNSKLNTIKQIYIDCAKFNRVLFSMHIKESNIGYLFMNRNIKSTFELLIPMECKFDKDIHELFQNHQVLRQPVLFENLQYTPMNFT